MLFTDTYLTIEKKSEGIFKDRGSKFIAYIYPVKQEQDVKLFLSELKKEHHGARHHCYAYRLGADKLNYRTNDDGEPSGTAGKPIFGQIQSNDLTDILIVVVRYFGGTLLGTGGLINAYRNAATEAIKNNKIIEKFVSYRYSLTFDFANMNDIMKIIKESEAKIHKQEYNQNCEIEFSVRKRQSEKTSELLSKIPNIKLTFLSAL